MLKPYLKLIEMVCTVLPYGPSVKLIHVQTPLNELTTSGKQIKSISWREVDTYHINKIIVFIFGENVLHCNLFKSNFRRKTAMLNESYSIKKMKLAQWLEIANS